MPEDMSGKGLTEYAEDSDIHGIKHLIRKDYGPVRRGLWVVVFLVAVGMLVRNTTLQIIGFFNYEHVTVYDIDYASQLVFPAITICNANKHRRTALTKRDIAVMGPSLGLTDSNFNLLHPELYPSDWYNETFNGTDWNATLASASVLYDCEGSPKLVEEYDLEDFINRTGHQFKDLVQYCQWKDHECDSNAWKIDLTHDGKCYTFNSKGNHGLKKAGSGNGLQLYLYVEDDEYLEVKHSEDLGIKFQPHHPIEPPFIRELGFGMSPGNHYLVALQQKEVVGLPEPYGPCVEDFVTTYFSNYTIPGCRIECETKEVYETCGCRLVESPGDYPICKVEQLECAEDKLDEIEHSDACTCSSPCHVIEYPFYTSSLKIRSATMDKLRSLHPVPEKMSTENMMVLNVYFDVLASEKVEQTPAYTLLSILSDLGGNLGLWLGASILAAAQVLDQLLETCYKKCCKNSYNNRKVNGNNNNNISTVDFATKQAW